MNPGRPKRTAATICAWAAIAAGTLAFLIAGIQGRRAGWGMMMLFSAPAAFAAVVAIAIQPRPMTYVAPGFGVLGTASLFLAA